VGNACSAGKQSPLKSFVHAWRKVANASTMGKGAWFSVRNITEKIFKGLVGRENSNNPINALMSFKNVKIAGVGVNSDNYHSQTAERGTPDFIMSPSSLKLFTECPARWKAGYQPPDSDAKDWGSLLDTLLLTPEQFKSRYAIKPASYHDAKTSEEKPWNGNSTVCKNWLEEHKDFQVVSAADVFLAQCAVNKLRADEAIASFLDASDKQVHLRGEWHDPATKLVIQVQCLIDCAPRLETEWFRNLGDLKSTRNAGQRPFARWCYTAGYHLQGAFDLDLYNATLTTSELQDKGRNDWVFIIQENYPPFETGRRLLSQDFIQIGRQSYQHALKQYARAMKTGVWPGYDESDEFSIINPEPWMEFTALSEALEHDQTEAAEIGEDLYATA
jgi:hypothetical protein